MTLNKQISLTETKMAALVSVEREFLAIATLDKLKQRWRLESP